MFQLAKRTMFLLNFRPKDVATILASLFRNLTGQGGESEVWQSQVEI